MTYLYIAVGVLAFLAALVLAALVLSGWAARLAESWESAHVPLDDDDAAYTEQRERHSGGGSQ